MYLPLRPTVIGVLLLVVVGIAGFNPENAPLDASDEHRLELETVDSNVLCDITFRGRHGGASDEITIDFRESQVRTRVGWWAAIARGRGEWGGDGPDPGTVTLRPGDTFERDYSLTFGCNARRRYRFHITADGNEHTLTYPSEDEFTQQTLVDLGDVSRFFGWIEPGAGPVAGAPVEINGTSLEGEWVRIGNNYDPHNRMRIQVSGDQATLTYVPETADRGAWREGDLIWQGISSDGSLDVLGSNDRYYDARLAFDGSNRLDIDVLYNGVGNDQTWERTGEPTATTACTWNTSGTVPAADVWTTASTSMPPEFLDALRAVKRADVTIQTLAIAPDDEWVVVADNIPCYSGGFSTGIREHIDGYIASGREIDVVAFGSGGRWVVIAEDWMRRSGVPEAAADWVRRLQGDGRRIAAFAFAPDAESVAMASDGEVFTFGLVIPDGFVSAVAAARTGQRPIHDVAFSGGGAWAVVAGDWFATDGVPLSLFQDLHRYRTDEDRRIDHVVLDSRPGGSRWGIVSNQPEPAPMTNADNMERFMGPSSGSIWARMDAYDIRGLAIAVVENNQIAWARGYGFRGGTDHERYVYPTTIFDAASVGKPVAAAGVLQLVDDGKLELTRGGVLLDLAGSVVPPHNIPALTALDPGAEVTLARLLSHCAGLDHVDGRSGAQSFGLGEEHPSLNQMIFGLDPASEGKKVVRNGVSGNAPDYSGANLLLVQALIEVHADSGFNAHMRRLLSDLEMIHSTFDTPRPDRSNYARGYDVDENDTDRDCGGTCPVKAYPNQAAASLTSTVMDLARFVIMLNQGGEYAGRRVLRDETVNRMLKRDGTSGSSLVEQQCISPGTFGLTMQVRNSGANNERFWHRGTHNGFRAHIYGWPQRDIGLILLMTGDGDDATLFTRELKSRFDALYP